MPVSWTLLIVLALAGAGYLLTRMRAVAMAGGDTRKLHSRPGHYGWNAALLTALPALLIAVWRFVQPAAHRR
jgi:phosphate transport system permease protein